MKKEKYDRSNTYNKKMKQNDKLEDNMFEIDDFYFEKEYRRKKREITQKKKKEKRNKEDRWN
jgi:hypothetical protein